MATLQKGRHALLRTSGVTTALVGVLGLCTGLVMSAKAEPGVAVHPVRPVSPDNAAADPSHHFLVLVEGDAQLYQNESEGTVLVGGDVAWRGYQVAPKSASYTVPGDDAPAGLVVLGALDFAGSTGGRQTLTVQNGANAHFGDLSGATVLRNGGVTYVVPTGGNGGTLPKVELQRAETEASIRRDPGFDVPALFATYRQLAAEIAQCPTTVELLDGNGNGPWPGTGVATIRLRPGQNVVNVSVAQLRTLANINLAPGSAQLGAATLVINVTDTGSYDLPVPNVGFQGAANAAHVFWNLAAAGTVTLTPEEGDTVWGTIYAPGARLVDHSTANIEGNVVVRELVHGGQATGVRANEDGGEIHDTPFLGTITPCAASPTTTTTTTDTTTETTTTTDSTTTTTTDSTTTTTEPTTTTESTTTTTEPVTTGPTTTATTTVPTVPGPQPSYPDTGGEVPPGDGWPTDDDPDLASTGFPAAVLMLGGVTLTATGLGLVTAARRRERRDPRP